MAMGVLGIAALLSFCSLLVNVRRLPASTENIRMELDFLATSVTGFVLILLFEALPGTTFRFSWLWFGAFLTIARRCVEVRAAGLAPVRQTVVRQVPAFPPNAWGSYAR